MQNNDDITQSILTMTLDSQGSVMATKWRDMLEKIWWDGFLCWSHSSNSRSLRIKVWMKKKETDDQGILISGYGVYKNSHPAGFCFLFLFVMICVSSTLVFPLSSCKCKMLDLKWERKSPFGIAVTPCLKMLSIFL